MGWLLRVLVTFIGRTLRLRLEDSTEVFTQLPRGAVIFAVWHNRLFLVPYLYQKYWHGRRRDRMVVMVSASKDGEKLTRVLARFHLICVRGSSSRRGRTALLEMSRYVNDGYDAGITPDGPRGPKYRVAPGVISLAQLTGAPIIPISWDVSRKITLKSWDGFMIPLPFARATLRMGEAIHVHPTADLENKRLELENVLKSLSEV